MKLINSDCIFAMKEMPDNSVDSIVTDPPYELGFMGKSWDSTGIANSVEMWSEALRILKPGGHLIAFSGSRTYHRMAVAIEDAGFQIRDQIMWVYGSGFPKSHNISKGLDKSENNEVWENNKYGGGNSKCDTCGKWMISGNPCQCPKLPIEFKTDAAKQWQGWGTALKPAHEPMVLARKPLEGTVANNVLIYGVGGLNIDGTRVEGIDEANAKRLGKNYGENQSRTFSQIKAAIVGGNVNGRFPANFIHDGSDEVLELFPESKGGAYPAKRGQAINTAFASGQETEGGFRAMGDSGSAARFFYCAKASKRDRNEGLDGFALKKNSKMYRTANNTSDTISAGFERFDTAPQSNNHPTVKPTSLMQYLVRLVTPPHGIVLDPFMGSGSTGKACAYEGFDFIGIDQSKEYVEIAKARIDFALTHKTNELLF